MAALAAPEPLELVARRDFGEVTAQWSASLHHNRVVHICDELQPPAWSFEGLRKSLPAAWVPTSSYWKDEILCSHSGSREAVSAECLFAFFDEFFHASADRQPTSFGASWNLRSRHRPPGYS